MASRPPDYTSHADETFQVVHHGRLRTVRINKQGEYRYTDASDPIAKEPGKYQVWVIPTVELPRLKIWSRSTNEPRMLRLATGYVLDNQGKKLKLNDDIWATVLLELYGSKPLPARASDEYLDLLQEFDNVMRQIKYYLQDRQPSWNPIY